jgi:hypothetical protein
MKEDGIPVRVNLRAGTAQWRDVVATVRDTPEGVEIVTRTLLK